MQKKINSEEIANSLTHGIGFGLSVAGLSVLVVLAATRGDVWRVVSFSIFGASMVLLYLASTFYHLCTSSKHKRLFRFFDHAAVYILIAGTYTPFTLVTLRGGWGWSIFGVVWGLALACIILKVFLIDRFEALFTMIYVFMGWIIIISIKPVISALPSGGLALLFTGGGLYTAGVIFFMLERIPWNHAIWHLFVLGGSICHYFAILLYVLPASID